jgi:hypothetical protein
LRVLRIGLLLALVLLVGSSCGLLSQREETAPAEVPPGFTAVPTGGCGMAVPSDWKRDYIPDGPLLYEGASGHVYLHGFTELEPTRPDEPLSKFVSVYAKTTIQVTSREAIQVPGAEGAFRMRLAGANGSTHLLVYGHDDETQSSCWLVVTPAGETAEQVARSFAVGEG